MNVYEWDRAVQEGRVFPNTFRGHVAVAFAIAVQKNEGVDALFPEQDEAPPEVAPMSMPDAFERICDELVQPGGPAWSAHRVGDVARGKRDLALDELSDLMLGGSPFRDHFLDCFEALNPLLSKATKASRLSEKSRSDVTVIPPGCTQRPPITGGAVTQRTLTATDTQALAFQELARRNAQAAFVAERFTEARLWREAADAAEKATAAAQGRFRPASQRGEPIEWARWALAQRSGQSLSPKLAESMVRKVAGRAAAPTNKQLATALGWMVKAKEPEARRVSQGQYVATAGLKRSVMSANG